MLYLISKLYFSKMGTQIQSSQCGFTWDGNRKPGVREYMVPPFLGYFTPIESERPSDWCKWSDKPRRSDARIIGGKKQTYGSGRPTLNSSSTDVWGIGYGLPGQTIKASTAEGSVNLPMQSMEVVKNHFVPAIDDIEQLLHNPDTRLQHPPARYFK